MTLIIVNGVHRCKRMMLWVFIAADAFSVTDQILIRNPLRQATAIE
tara:strand:+ start:2451 stop:2588 length:138 start_codon:yes stop_codon:yes gene_type:complete